MKQYLCTALVLLIALTTWGCAKVPEAVQTPGVKVDFTIMDNREVYIVSFSGGIPNDNGEIALTDVSGTIEILASDGDKIDAYDFSIPKILPFDIGIIDLRFNRTEQEIEPLLALLNITREELVEGVKSGGTILDEENVRLTNFTCTKKDIIELLKEKS